MLWVFFQYRIDNAAGLFHFSCKVALFPAGADLYFVGFLNIIASNVASFVGGIVVDLEAFECKPCNCFLLRPPLSSYCLLRLWDKFRCGKINQRRF